MPLGIHKMILQMYNSLYILRNTIQDNIRYIFAVFKSIFTIGHRDILQGKNSQGKFEMFLSLSFHNYKIVFKVRISSPLQT